MNPDPPAPGPAAFRIAASGSLPVPLETAIAALTDVRCAETTLHWGRNHLYVVRLGEGGRTERFVVKEFRHATWWRRLQRRWRGDKAMLSWAAAKAALEAGIPTPDPVLALLSDDPAGPSYFVTRFAQGRVEARALLREVRSGEFVRFTRGQAGGFVRAAARLARRMHDAGIRHRDFSMGNLLLRFDGGDEPDIVLVDLNRARCGPPPGSLDRLRDLCRLEIPDPGLRKAFLDTYEGGTAGRGRRFLYEWLSRSFAMKNPLKRALRAPLGALLRPFQPAKKPPPHLAPAGEGTPMREAVVWDPLTEQPFHHAGKARRHWERLKDLPALGAEAWAIARALPSIRRARRRPLSSLPCGRIGLGLAHGTRLDPVLLEFLEEANTRHVFLRLNAWENLDGPEALAKDLKGRGFDLAFGIAQDRGLVREPLRWERAVEEIAARFLPLGGAFQIGQAVNRSKWGFWTRREYLDLARRAAVLLRKADPAVRLLGPSVIDFEPLALAAALHLPAPGFALDAVSCLLYVDRRGAPENSQYGLDLQAKVRWFDAIARASRHGGGSRLWITETNWPLRAGPHSPAGRGVAVDEEAQADYLVRYMLLALATGAVERVYWWQLAARGYGLLDVLPDGTLRARPAYRAFRVLAGILEGTENLEEVGAERGGRLVKLEGLQGTVWAGWAPRAPVRIAAPPAACRAWGRDGEELGLDSALTLTGSVHYFAEEAAAVPFHPAGVNG